MAKLLKAWTFQNEYTGPDPKAWLARIRLDRLHPGQVIPFATMAQQQTLVQGRSAEDPWAKYFTSLGPQEVPPTKQAETDKEWLLVARGHIAPGFFERVPLRAFSAGARAR